MDDDSRTTLWNKIQQHLQLDDLEFIALLKTKAGNTQSPERTLIDKIRSGLTDMNLSFQEAGSQQSKDFRNVGGVDLDIEVKKTDSFTVYFNDTCPSKDIYYIIVFTGKTYSTKQDIPPKIIFVNGQEFIKDSPWITEYHRDITRLKDKYARGEAKKMLPGIMEVYPRPTYKANIERFIREGTDLHLK